MTTTPRPLAKLLTVVAIRAHGTRAASYRVKKAVGSSAHLPGSYLSQAEVDRLTADPGWRVTFVPY